MISPESGIHSAAAAFNQRRFSSAVFSNQGMNFAFFDVEGYVVQRDHAGIGLFNMI
jgi:hypothetical protein